MALFLPGLDPSSAREQMLEAVRGRFLVEALVNRELRSAVLDAFERTFAITTAMYLVAAVVSVVAIITVLFTLVAERRRLEQTLMDMGLRTLPSDANFVLFFTERAAETQRRLADDHGVIVRDRSDMKGLAGGLRVTVGTAEENDRFLEALREVMA